MAKQFHLDLASNKGVVTTKHQLNDFVTKTQATSNPNIDKPNLIRLNTLMHDLDCAKDEAIRIFKKTYSCGDSDYDYNFNGGNDYEASMNAAESLAATL